MSAADAWFAAGVRTPFAKVDGALGEFDAIGLSVPVVRHMVALLGGATPDFAVWGAVAPNLTWSNIAREVLMDAGVSPSIPAYSTVMACATSLAGAIQAAGMLDGRDRTLALVGGVESMSRIQLGLGQSLSDWLRKFGQARSLEQKATHFKNLRIQDIRLYVPSVTNRTTGLSMGEHTEITAKEWDISRAEQDQVALESHQRAVAAWEAGFFDDLVMPLIGPRMEVRRDTLPRNDSSMDSLAKLKPSFDRSSGKGTLTAGNSSPLTDGAAALWVATREGLSKLPPGTPAARLVDWDLSAVDFRAEGLLMAPAFSIPRLLARNGLRYEDIDLWEIHEAFAAQVLFHIKALESTAFLRNKARIEGDFGRFPRERLNPNGGTVALGHPFGATGARILSQAVKELAQMPAGRRAIVSICADGGQGGVVLLEAGGREPARPGVSSQAPTPA